MKEDCSKDIEILDKIKQLQLLIKRKQSLTKCMFINNFSK